MESDAFPAEEGARVANWLDGLQFRGLCLPEGLSVDRAAREREGARAAAAGLAGEVWDAGGTGIAERVQAAQFVSAHAAAMDWQAEANRRDLPPHARATAQRLARQLMALTTAQLNGLCRLKAERRKDREQAMRLAEQTARRAERETAAKAAAKAAVESRAWSADRRALVADMERTLKAGIGPRAAAGLDRELDPGLDAALDPEAMADLDLDKMADAAITPAAPLAPPKASPKGAPPGTEPPGTAAPDPLPAPGSAGGFAEASAPPRPATPEPLGAGAPAEPEPVGAGVPETTPEPAPPLNRRQRRALERLRRKGRRREGVG